MTVLSPATALAAVRTRIQDENETKPFVADSGIDMAIQNAVRDYSRTSPYSVVVDIDGAAVSYIDLADVSEWTEGFSSISEVEYPASDPLSDSTWPIPLDPQRDWREYRAGGTTYLHLLNAEPALGEVIRVVLTTPHVLTEESNTIPAQDYLAVLDLAASYACLVAASRAAASHDGQMRSTGVRYGDAHDRWLAAARVWETRYRAHVGLGAGGLTESAGSGSAGGGDAAAASVTMDWDQVPGFDGLFLTHQRRIRTYGD